MEKIIKAAVERGASDLHIKAGDVFRARINGRLVPLTKQALTPEQTRTIALHLMPNDDDKARIDNLTDYDCSWSANGIGRFRVNILKQRNSFMIVMRVIPFEVPTFEKLRLPAALANVARGALLDEEAVADLLERGRLRGAVLDVFREEPLPATSRLWSLPNALIMPHTSPVSPRRFWPRQLDLFLSNWHRYVRGEPLLNLVDKHAGY